MIPMQPISILAAGALLGGGVWFWYAGLPAQTELLDLRTESQVSVVLTESGFDPAELQISQGTTVVFTTTAHRHFWPASNLHPSHEIYSAFDPKRPLAPEEEWGFVFNEAGEWGFHDHIRSYYQGVIYVEAR
jgi:plastocyanin